MINTSGYVSLDFEGMDDGIKSRTNIQNLYPTLVEEMRGYHLKELWEDLSGRGYYFKGYRAFCKHVASAEAAFAKTGTIPAARRLFHQAPSAGAAK